MTAVRSLHFPYQVVMLKPREGLMLDMLHARMGVVRDQLNIGQLCKEHF